MDLQVEVQGELQQLLLMCEFATCLEQQRKSSMELRFSNNKMKKCSRKCEVLLCLSVAHVVHDEHHFRISNDQRHHHLVSTRSLPTHKQTHNKQEQ